MRTVGIAGLWCGIVFGSTALATPVESPLARPNPYDSIAQRNVFALREPISAPIPAPEPPAAKDSGELLLTGIVDFRTAQWALLTLTERGKPPQGYTLAVGQKQGDLEVLAIDAAAATATVRHGLSEVVLRFDARNAADHKRPDDLNRKYVEQARAFVDEHTRAHAAREQREAERRKLERAAADGEIAERQISHQP